MSRATGYISLHSLSPRSFSVHVWTSLGTHDYSASCSDSPCSSLSRILKITQCDSLLPACFFLLHQRRQAHICFSKIFSLDVKLTFVSQKPFLWMSCPTLMICINMLTRPCILIVKNLYWTNIFIFIDLFFVDIAECFSNIFHIVTKVDVCKLHIREFFTNKMRMISLLFLFGYGTTNNWIPNSKVQQLKINMKGLPYILNILY
jgi:hypothetical protein